MTNISQSQIERIASLINRNSDWKKIFDSAVYWEGIRNELFKGDGSEDNEEKYQIAHEQFMHYWKQIGGSWYQWQALKLAV